MSEVKQKRSILSLKSLKRRLSHQLRIIDNSRLTSLKEHHTDSNDQQLLANNLTNNLNNMQLNVDAPSDTVKYRQKRHQDLRKRLSLPPEVQLPADFLARQSLSPTLDGTINRQLRRTSMSEIGFGKLESYKKLSKIGSGTYATVFRGESLLTESIVALKEIRLEHEEGTPCTAIREVSILKDLKHANIVTLHDTIHTDISLTLVFEYVEQDLKQYMDKHSNILSMHNVKLLLYQLLRGLSYCHHRRVLHRDLKPQNLLITDRGELKLGDFGLARAKSIPTKTYSNEVITLWYRPPDILLGSTDYYCHIDMWGVACIFYEMTCGRPVFPGTTVDDQLRLVFKLLGTPNTESWPGIDSNSAFADLKCPEYSPTDLVRHAPRLDSSGLKLLQSLFIYDVNKRISASNALKHEFFRNLPDSISSLKDVENIFDGTGLKFEDNHRLKPHTLKQRRQSLLF